MKLFDSHCHLNDRTFKDDVNVVINRAFKTGIKAIMVVGITEKTSKLAITIAKSFPGVYASLGIHPHDAQYASDESLNHLKIQANHPKVKAWGETGLDFNRMFSPQTIQEKWFKKQIEIALELNLPVIFHERDSKGRFLDILKTTSQNMNINGVVHCFSGNQAELKAYLDMGLYIGITGIITVKSRGADIRRLVSYIPNDRLVVETDAPYLTPSPERNKHKRNEPAFVKSVFMKLAEVKQQDATTFAETIWNNTCRLFQIV